MTITIYTSPDGTEYRTLPRTWGGATNITERWALAHGWSKTTREEPAPAPPLARYSKYKLHRALADAGVWDMLWGAIVTAGYSQYWNDAQELAEDDELFEGALAVLAQQINLGEIELPKDTTVDAILEEARIA